MRKKLLYDVYTTNDETELRVMNTQLLTSYDLLIDVEDDVEEADRKKGEIGQKSAVFMILRRFATGKS